MFVPVPASMPMGATVFRIRSNHPDRSDVPVRLLPSQYVHITVTFNVCDGFREVGVLATYQFMGFGEVMTSLAYQAINQSEVSFIFGWSNASHLQFPQFFSGFIMVIGYDGPSRFKIEGFIHRFGDFTYFAGLILITISAIPLWSYYFVSRKRKRIAWKLSEGDA
jgi:hypothetical protein